MGLHYLGFDSSVAERNQDKLTAASFDIYSISFWITLSSR